MYSNKESGLCLVCNEQQIEPDPLHSSVCPNCSFVAIDKDADKIIIFDDMMRYRRVRVYGGFGIKTYRFIPHACKSCKSVFVSWESETKVNVPVIILCLMLAFWTVVAILGCVFLGLGGSADLGLATAAISVLVAFLMGCGIATQTEDGKDFGPEVLKDYIWDSEMEEIQEALNPKPKKSKDAATTGTGYDPLMECTQATKEALDALWRIEI